VGFRPPLLSLEEVDEVIPVATADAVAMARHAARLEGIWSGPSTGASLVAAVALARRLGPDARVAVIQVDSGLKYLRGEVYA
jgi:cysteine synthase A